VDLAERKRRLRRELRERLRTLVPAQGEEASRRVAALLAGSPELASARRVILYASLPDELPSRPLLEVVRAAGCPALLPRPGPRGVLEVAALFGWEELVPGRYGVPEPPAARGGSALGAGDLVLVPGLAFDRSGHRLGRGAGFWDRTFAAAGDTELRAVGVGLACQLLEAVPYGPDDHRLHAILTEEGWHRVSTGRGS
jgi:5-formyltetrahydrofolate cyclo-ligase